MNKMKKLYAQMGAGMTVAAMSLTNAFANDSTTPSTPATMESQFDAVVNPVVDLINSLLSPLLAIVGAVGALYCVLLGVKFAKAEEPQDREKAKGNLKNAIIGFVLIFVLLVVLKLLMPVLKGWAANYKAI